jgi:hypothetical protein
MTSTGLLDDRRREQLTVHRTELADIIRDHIQSTQPTIRLFTDRGKDMEKILRKSLTLINQPKILSYEQMRHELKCEYKQTFFIVDPIVDIVRDTLNHCDITQMTEKTNGDLLKCHIGQTAFLYNQPCSLLNVSELDALRTGRVSWLQDYLIDQESKEKKLTRKQNKELSKILVRAWEILSLNVLSKWDELVLQLQREFVKAHDLCSRAVDLIKQSHKIGHFLLEQAPESDRLLTKRRASSLITERARQNLRVNRAQIILSIKKLFVERATSFDDEQQFDMCLSRTFDYLDEQQPGQFKDYNDLKVQLRTDHPRCQSDLIEQMIDVIEQAHASNQFDDIDKSDVQTLLKDRLNGKRKRFVVRQILLVVNECFFLVYVVALSSIAHQTDVCFVAATYRQLYNIETDRQ